MYRLLLFILLFVPFLARAGNVVSVSTATGHPGDEVEMTIGLQNDDEVSALEIVIPLAGAASLVDGSATLSDRGTGHSISAVMAGDDLHIYVYSMSLNAIGGNQGELCSFKLLLNKQPGTYSLTPQVMLSNAAGQEVASETQAGQLVVLAPDLELVTSEVNFGRVPIRGTYTQYVQVRNTGNEPCTIGEVEFDNTDFKVDQLPIIVPAGSVQSVPVTYRPVDRSDGVKSWMTIISDAVSGKKKLYVNAIPFSVNELHVQRAQGEVDEVVEVEIKVNNMEPLVGMQCTFNLPTQLDYVAGSVKAGERAVGSTAFAALDGRKLTLYLYSANNTAWTGDDGVVVSFKVKLNGTSGWYNLNPTDVVLSNISQENMTSASYGGYVIISAPRFNGNNTIDMGVTPVPEVVEASYSVYNSGQVPLVIDRIAFLNDGFEIVDNLPVEIEPRESSTLIVRHTTDREGPFSTTMNIYSNDPLQRMTPVTISGEKYAPNTLSVTGERSQSGYDLHFAMDNWSQDLTAIQMDIHWPASVTYSSVTTTRRLSGHSVMVIPLGDNTWRVLIYSMGNQVIPENDGELFTMHFTCDSPIDYMGTTVTVDGITVSDVKSIDKYSGGDLTHEIPMLITDATLAELITQGVVDEIYRISNNLLAVYANDTNGILWCKDLGDASVARTDINEGQVDFMKVLKAQIGDWDQSNWVALKFSTPTTTNGVQTLIEGAVGKLIKANSIIGIYDDEVNYSITMIEDKLDLDEDNSVANYIKNVYCASNFLPENLNIWGDSRDGAYTIGSQQNYFFMNPKIQEVCNITFAQWDAVARCFTVPSKSGFDGAFNIDLRYNSEPNPSLEDEAAYEFAAVVQRTRKDAYVFKDKNVTPSDQLIVYPLDLTTGSKILTGINKVDVNDREIVNVKYVSVTGVISSRPFSGVNIVVTEYSDGSRSTIKMTY